MKPSLLILGLHRVGTPPPNAKIRGLFITPQLLRFQLATLRRLGYRFTTLSEAMADVRGRRAVITFDDGYLDNISNALPVLDKFGAPATIFAITGDVGRKQVIWDEAGEDLPADMLDWEDLRTLQKRGWEVGSHAHSHIHLERYSRREQHECIRRSITEIETNLGTTPVSFAYPYGSYNDDTTLVLKELGMRYAVTTRSATPADEQPDAPLELARLSLGGRRFYHFVKALRRTNNALGGVFSRFASSLTPARFEFPFRQADDLAIFRRPADNALRSSR